MPAEWEPHAGCLMAWPCRADLWEGRLDEARAEFERAVSLTRNSRERELLLKRAAACVREMAASPPR